MAVSFTEDKKLLLLIPRRLTGVLYPGLLLPCGKASSPAAAAAARSSLYFLLRGIPARRER